MFYTNLNVFVQDLSLPIPGKDDTARLHGLNTNQLPLPVSSTTSGPCADTESYSYRFYEIWEWLKRLETI